MTLGGFFIALLVGIIAGGATYFIINIYNSKHISGSIDFDSASKKVKKGLVEKKEAYEKEMTDQVQQKIDETRKQLADLDNQYVVKSADYKDKVKNLDEDFQRKKEEFAEIARATQAEQTQMLADEIANLKAQQQTKIATLAATYEKEKERLGENFQTFSDEINTKKATLAEEIKAFEQKKTAIIEQFKKDEEIRQQRDFYHISLSSLDLSDIQKLKSMAPGFSRPEIFYKLLYETYYKAAIEELFKRVLGENKEKGGIYKITNINNEKVYIGKTTKFIDRWRTHAKRGCNIDRISGQIYEAMFAEGLENFTWEIVEVCSKDDQTDREKYWIEFYHSDQYGYNIRKG